MFILSPTLQGDPYVCYPGRGENINVLRRLPDSAYPRSYIPRGRVLLGRRRGIHQVVNHRKLTLR